MNEILINFQAAAFFINYYNMQLAIKLEKGWNFKTSVLKILKLHEITHVKEEIIEKN